VGGLPSRGATSHSLEHREEEAMDHICYSEMVLTLLTGGQTPCQSGIHARWIVKLQTGIVLTSC
jgi:hypothetical protein